MYVSKYETLDVIDTRTHILDSYKYLVFLSYLLLPIDDLATSAVEDGDFGAFDLKIGTYGQQLHSGSTMAQPVIVRLPGLATTTTIASAKASVIGLLRLASRAITSLSRLASTPSRTARATGWATAVVGIDSLP